ncbi:MAG: tRNA pseudouridine(38-40) synthase TruA [Chromatiales bacterium]
MRVAIGLEYDGRGFQGWQYLGEQRDVRTVQGCAQQALSRVAGEPVKPVCAGRTDSGVHALGQVIHIDTNARRSERAWVLGANSNLPDDVSVTWAREVPPQFHARYSATGRIYRYVILNSPGRSGMLSGRVTWEHRLIDVAKMQQAAPLLVGEHDFSAFRAAECQSMSAVREVKRLDVWREGDLVVVEIEANAFLQRMVRNIAGVLMAIGAGKASVHWAREVLESRDRRQGGVTAPADGLYLVRVMYPESFELPPPPRYAMLSRQSAVDRSRLPLENPE